MFRQTKEWIGILGLMFGTGLSGCGGGGAVPLSAEALLVGHAYYMDNRCKEKYLSWSFAADSYREIRYTDANLSAEVSQSEGAAAYEGNAVMIERKEGGTYTCTITSPDPQKWVAFNCVYPENPLDSFIYEGWRDHREAVAHAGDADNGC